MTDGGVTPSNVCLDLAKKKCDFYIRCRTDQADNQGRNNDQVAAGERAKCEATFANDRGCVVGAAAWANGRATLDPQKYTDCINATYPSNTCVRDINDAQKKCQNAPFVTPATAAGGACTGDSDCIKGWCSIPAGSICGTCQAWLNGDGGVGANCARDSQCDLSRSFCIGPDSNNSSGNPCRAYTAVDAGCNFTSTNQEECGPGNVCMGTAAGFNNVPKCLPGKLENAPCTKNRLECQRSGRGTWELLCATDSQGFDTCQKRFNTTALGRCGTGEFLFGQNNQNGTFCQESEFCATGLCANRRAANQTCNGTDQCQAGLQCVQNLCIPYVDVDGGCATSTVCKNLLSCRGNTCQAGSSLIGGACGNSGGTTITCAEGFCGQAAVTTCTALLADGQACNSPTQCESYSCVNNLCAKACWKP